MVNLIKPTRLLSKVAVIFFSPRGGGLFAGVGKQVENSLRITEREVGGASADPSWCRKGN